MEEQRSVFQTQYVSGEFNCLLSKSVFMWLHLGAAPAPNPTSYVV